MAPRNTTAGRLLFDDIVPEHFRHDMPDEQPLDSKSIQRVLQRVAEKSPHLYRDISHNLLKFGAKGSTETEASFGLKDLRSPIDKMSIIKEIEKKEDALFANKALTPEQRDRELVKIYGQAGSEMPDKVYGAALSQGSNLARMVASGARGNKGQLNSNIGADWLMLDANSRPVPVPIKNSYAEGLSPAEYFAASYGTRKGLISTKFSTRETGYLNKQLSAAAHDIVVTAHDCDTGRGIPTTPDDRDNVGAVLAKSCGGHPAGTVLTTRSLKDLRDHGVKSMTVRSPLTCQAHNGICAVCAGKRERGHFPHLMDNIGLAAGSSLAEPITQSALSEKHSGGVANSSGKAQSAFQRVDSLVQIPEVFPNGATISQLDGTVGKIEDAPQGGKYVHVGDQKHYVAPDFDLKVKSGDTVEAGDVLSGGIPSPAEIVKHKGVGAGRLYFTQALGNVFHENKLPVSRRNLEVIGRALVNHVRVTNPDGMGDHLPDDVVEYNALENGWKPAADSVKVKPHDAIGKYLQTPVMHYSVGTRITPSVAKNLHENDEHEIEVADQHPGFEPEMVRVMDVPGYKDDWVSQFASSYVKKRLLQNVHAGNAVSHTHGTSYVPGLAKATEFGKPPAGTVGY